MTTSGEEAADRKIGWARRLMLGSVYCLVTALALVGFFGLLLEGYFWSSGSRWHAGDINALLTPESPFMHAVQGIWSSFAFILQYGAYFLAGLAFLLAVTQIKAISNLISLFITARGPIYQLAATLSSAEEHARNLATQASRLNELEPTIRSMSEQVEEAVARIGDLQRQSVSERVDASEDEVGLAAPQRTLSVDVADEDPNWEKLRELWNANGARLDAAIEQIGDKRKRMKFSRMDRRNYPAIINGLAEEGHISPTAQQGSLDLHATFVRYRPRNRTIPDSVIGALVVKDKMLEEEFARLKTTPGRTRAPVENQSLETV